MGKWFDGAGGGFGMGMGGITSSAVFAPGGSPAAWYDAAAEAYSDGNPVTTINDQSGNSNNLVEAHAPSDTPTFKTSIANGYPVFRFSGGAATDCRSRLTLTQGTLSQPFMFTIVANFTAAFDGTDRTAIGEASDNVIRLLNNNTGAGDAGKMGGYGGAYGPDGATQMTSTFRVITYLYNGASSQIWENNVAGNTGNAGTGTLVGICVGNNRNRTQCWPGDIAEVLIYEGDQSGAVRAANDAALVTKYGL
jgi:hypothetical protein